MSRPLVAVALALLGGTGVTPGRAAQTPEPPAAEALLDAKHALMAATYYGDLDALARLTEELGGIADRDSLAWLARYHAGFAHYVLALMVGPNGLRSRAGDVPAMLRQVDYGIGQLEASLAIRADFADALALLSNLYAMKLRGNPQRFARDLGPKAADLLERALQLAPRNPRVVLIDAMQLFWTPERAGGDRVKGLARWREACALFGAEVVPDTSPLPSWGHAEAWAWLPAAYMAIRPPDFAEAERAAMRSLQVQPGYRWVRLSVLPQIEARRRQ